MTVAGASGAVFVGATALAASGPPPRWEVALFQAVNDLPDWLYVVIWPFMQYGVFVTIPIAATVALLLSHRRLGVLLATSGVGIYVAAKVVKALVDRGRPGAFVADVVAREHFTVESLGYTSGHAAVAATIATLTAVHLPRPWRRASIALVAIVAFGRMYVGAHLPLDLVGGIAMGVATGATVTHLFSAHERPPEEASAMADTLRPPRPQARPAATAPATSGRHPGDAVRVLLGLGVLAVALLAVQRDRLTTFEGDLFRLVNDLPAQLSPVLEVVMQAGNVAAAGVGALAMLVVARRHRRAALDVALAGTLAWFAAKLVKDLVGRPRPTGFFEEVLRFSDEGLGFVSGHTAVAAAIVTAAAPYLPRTWRRALWLLPWVVGFTRIYVGAHLPLDVVGGAALGWVVGAGIHLLLGAPHRIPGLDEAARVLRRAGTEVTHLARVPGTPRGSFPFVASTVEDDVFVKLLDPEPRDRDWLYRAARFLAFRDVRDEASVLDASAQAHREAAMTLLARCHGAQVPVIRGIEHDRDQVWLVQDHIDGRDLERLPHELVTDEVLHDAWAQVARIHGARVAHRDLVASNIVVDDGRAWIVDFAHAVSAAPARALDNDVAELLATTALLVGAERAVGAAREVLGAGALAGALPELQPLALTAETRRRLRACEGLLAQLRDEVTVAARLEAPPVRPARAVSPRPVALVAGAALVAVAGLVALAGSTAVLDELTTPAYRWLGLAVLALVATELLAASGTIAALGHRLAVGRVLPFRLAAHRTALLDAHSTADAALVPHLLRAGVPARSAGEALRRRAAMRAGLWVAAVVVAAVAAWLEPVEVDVPARAAALAVLGAVALALQLLARRTVEVEEAAGGQGGGGDGGSPQRAVLVLTAAAEVAGGVVCAVAATAAMGGGPPVAGVALVHLLAAGLARHGPVVGAPGTGEVVMAAGLSALGMALAPAVAAALTARLLLLWLRVLVGALVLAPLRRLAA